MHTNNPNRTKRRMADVDAILQKKSGDLHIDPQDEQVAAHRPHRVSRGDLQKIMPASQDLNEPDLNESDSDESASS